jgi:uncharacterized protein (DUF4415 family)
MRKPSRTNWKAIDVRRDSEIDYSDNPRLDAGFFARAVRWPGNKQLISLRLDPDVLAFFRRQGKGYQTTINALLRKYVEAQESEPASRARSQARKKPSNISKRSKGKKKSA